MNFLFPLYLLGAAAIAVPIVLHLRRRPPKDHVPFGSLMFLEKTPERLTRRTRIERWWLLALRCLALIALAFMFSRPLFPALSGDEAVAGTGRTVVLLDRSASMQREDLWDRALAAAEAAIEDRDLDHEAGAALFDETLTIIGDFPAWRDLSPSAQTADFRRAVAAETTGPAPGWKRTDLGATLIAATDWLSDSSGNEEAARHEIVIISDFAEGLETAALNEIAWPENVAVRCIPIAAEEESNLTLGLAARAPDTAAREAETHRIRVSRSGIGNTDRFSLEWEGFPATRIESYLAAGASRVIESPPFPAGASTAVLLLSGDAHDFDNRVHVAARQPRPLPILYLSAEEGGESAGTPLFYLRRAIQETSALAPSLRTAPVDQPLDPEGAEAIFVQGDWPVERSRELRSFAESGGLVIALTSEDTSIGSFGTLFDASGWTWKEADSSDYAMLAGLDFDHPVLAPFARAQIRDFTKIRFWKHRVLTIPDSANADPVAIAGFDTGSPALIESVAGDGRLYAFLSGWEPDESQLALSSKFVPILYSIFENSGYQARSAPTSFVGEARFEEPGGQLVVPEAPGFYEVRRSAGETVTRAVNVHPSEGKTVALDADTFLSEFGVVLASDQTSEEPSDDASRLARDREETERDQKLWKWLVLAVLIFLIAETWLAGRTQLPAAPAGS